MFSHLMIGSNDLDTSKKFYDALFESMGAKPGRQDAKGRLAYRHNGSAFLVTSPIDGRPANHGNGSTIGFNFDNPEAVDAWHKAGLEAGGTSIEDPPGVRQGSFGPLYLAYLRDPDGHKLCGLHRMPVEQ